MLDKSDLYSNPATAAHAQWAEEILQKHPDFPIQMRRRYLSVRLEQCLSRCCVMQAFLKETIREELALKIH